MILLRTEFTPAACASLEDLPEQALKTCLSLHRGACRLPQGRRTPIYRRDRGQKHEVLRALRLQPLSESAQRLRLLLQNRSRFGPLLSVSVQGMPQTTGATSMQLSTLEHVLHSVFHIYIYIYIRPANFMQTSTNSWQPYVARQQAAHMRSRFLSKLVDRPNL